LYPRLDVLIMNKDMVNRYVQFEEEPVDVREEAGIEDF